MNHRQNGFTLLEILLVVAAIGILAAIVIVAINPQRQLGKVRDAERQSEVGTLKDGIEQYSLDKNGEYPSEIEVNTYKEVCDTEAVAPSNCPDYYVDLSGLVPEQLAAIPRDPQASDTNEDTGYEVGKDGNGNIAVRASNTEVDNSVKRAGTTLVVGYSLSSASYDNQSFDVSGEDTDPRGITFNGDGTKMFVTGTDNDNVYSYNLSTAYDISSASYNQSFDLSGQDAYPTGMTFNGDGTKMFVVGQETNSVYSYNLSTAYDLGSTTYNQSYDVSGQDTYPRGVTFNGDGTKMFVSGENNENIYSYNLSTAYDLSTASYNQSFDVSGEDNWTKGVSFNGDGTKMFVPGSRNDSVYSYNMSTAYDLGSASYNQSFDVSGEDIDPFDVTFNGDGTKMFMVGAYTATVHRYSTTEEK
jgi:prepilin-type N-terminal cleavage/methylation domain-containing protein